MECLSCWGLHTTAVYSKWVNILLNYITNLDRFIFFYSCYRVEWRLLLTNINFQGWDDPYVPRTHEGLLKWKYRHMNSVDFLFEVVSSTCYIWCWDIAFNGLCFTYHWSRPVCCPLIVSCFFGQIDDGCQKLFLYERGKKKLMEGNRVSFRGQEDLYFLICLTISVLTNGLIHAVLELKIF